MTHKHIRLIAAGLLAFVLTACAAPAPLSGGTASPPAAQGEAMAVAANPHAVDAEDMTPLSRAAARNHTHVVDAINVDR